MSTPVQIPSFSRYFSARAEPKSDYTEIKGPLRVGQQRTRFTFDIYYHAGEPPPDLGSPSDIYLDVTDGQEQILAKINTNTWVRWPCLSSNTPKIFHPLVSEVFLYARPGQGITWVTQAILYQDKRKYSGGWPSVMEVINMTLETGVPGYQSKRAREDEIESIEGQKRQRLESSSLPQGAPALGGTLTPPAPPSPPRTPAPPLTPLPPLPSQLPALPERFLAPSPPPALPERCPTPALAPSLPEMNFLNTNDFDSHPMPPTPRPPSPLSPLTSDDEEMSDVEALPAKTKIQLLVDIVRQKINIFIKDRVGIEFPKTARIVTWLSGVQTVLPWTKKYKDIGDEVAVRHMADGADATRPENVLYPTCKCSNPCDIQCFPVNDFIVALAYNPEILEVDPLSSNILKSTSRTVNQNRRATRAHKKFMADLRRWLARGYLIVVREWKPDFHVTWNTESVRIFKGSTERLVDYQDAHLRAKGYGQANPPALHKQTTLSEFLALGGNSPETCGNCLDSPAVRGDAPPFILDLADCSKALALTLHLGGVSPPLCADYERRMALDRWAVEKGFRDADEWKTHKKTLNQRKTLRKLVRSKGIACQTCIALAAMSQDLQKQREEEIDQDWGIPLIQNTTFDPSQPPAALHYINPTLHRDKDKDVVETFQPLGHIPQNPGGGPSVFLSGSWMAQCWEIFTLAGFHTYPHHDASGYGTYSYVRHGCKIWGAIRLRFDPQKHQTRNSVFDVMRTILRPPPSLDYRGVSDIFNLFLLEGDVLIQPPNTIHQVFTPVNSIVSGGHLLPYETLHLTELSRAFDVLYNHVATNADHPGIHRTLCRMAMALKYLYKERAFYRRPILALAAMVCEPEAYEPHRHEEERPHGRCHFDTLRMETEEDTRLAQSIMKYILESHGLDLAAVKDELKDMGNDWKDGSGSAFDLSCLEAFSFS